MKPFISRRETTVLADKVAKVIRAHGPIGVSTIARRLRVNIGTVGRIVIWLTYRDACLAEDDRSQLFYYC